MRSSTHLAIGTRKVFFAALLVVFAGCDRWYSTSLRNDLATPAYLHLHYQWKGGELVKRKLPGEAGTDGHIWTTMTPDGEMPLCDRSVVMVDSGEVVDEVPEELLERWVRSGACVDLLPGRDAHVLHLTLAPGESLHLARALGPVPGHYLDSLVIEDGSQCRRLRTSEAIARVIDRDGGDEFTALTSRIMEMGGTCDTR